MKIIVLKNKFILTLFLVCLLFNSCASKKEKFDLIAKTIDIDYSSECDTTKLIYTSLKFDNTFFKFYKEAENKFKKNDLPFHHPYITWTNDEKKWLLNENDINFMLENKSKIIALKKNNIKSKKVIVLTYLPDFKNSLEKNKDLTKQILNCNYLFQFSLPVFNREHNKAIVMCKSISNEYYTYFIFIKDKKEWIFIGNSNNYTM